MPRLPHSAAHPRPAAARCVPTLPLALVLALSFALASASPAQAAPIRVTVTGQITNIFNVTTSPFSIGDPFTYEVLLDDEQLDQSADPDVTLHSYAPAAQAGVAGAASLTIGSYEITASDVLATTLTVTNDTTSDRIEIISTTSSASPIDGISPAGFSLKREDFSMTALSDAVVTPALFTSSGFGDVDAVYLFITTGGACVSEKCVIGSVDEIVAVPEPSSWALLGLGLAGLGLRHRRRRSS